MQPPRRVLQVFIRAIQLLTQHNKDTILVRAWAWAHPGGGIAAGLFCQLQLVCG